jgi:hypothetical protein
MSGVKTFPFPENFESSRPKSNVENVNQHLKKFVNEIKFHAD